MSDLISRQDAIDGFYNVKVHAEDRTEYDIGYNDGIDYAISKLSVMPSAEAVEVVRCKDCRHRDLFSCPLADNDFQKDEDFCSWGERKESE